MVKAMYSATICCFNELDTDDILMGCKGQSEFLCLREAVCCAANETPFPVGLLKDGICTLSLPCCQYQLKMPEVLVLGEGKCLCCRGAQAFPFKDPVPSPVCAICFLSILPEMGFLKPAPGGGGAPDNEQMAR